MRKSLLRDEGRKGGAEGRPRIGLAGKPLRAADQGPRRKCTERGVDEEEGG